MSFMVNQLIGFGVGGTAFSVAHQTPPALDGTNATSYTFSSAAIGNADGSRVVVVGIAPRTNSAASISSVTIGGNTATLGVTANATGQGADIASIYYLAVPSGTTADIVVNLSTTFVRCYINVWAVYGSSGAPTATTSDNTLSTADLSATISCNAGGAIIGMAEGLVSTGPLSWTWTNLTERSDTNADSDGGTNNNGFSGASDTFAAAQSSLAITATVAGTTPLAGGLALVAFGP